MNYQIPLDDYPIQYIKFLLSKKKILYKINNNFIYTVGNTEKYKILNILYSNTDEYLVDLHDKKDIEIIKNNTKYLQKNKFIKIYAYLKNDKPKLLLYSKNQKDRDNTLNQIINILYNDKNVLLYEEIYDNKKIYKKIDFNYVKENNVKIYEKHDNLYAYINSKNIDNIYNNLLGMIFKK